MKKLLIVLMLISSFCSFGQGKISEMTAAGTLTGAELMEVVQSGSNKKTTTQDVANLAVPKTYNAVLSQASTSAPTVSVSKNSLSGAVVYTRDGVGIYTGTLASAFPVTKTWFDDRVQYLPVVDKMVYFVRFDNNSFNIFVKTASTDTFVDLQYSDLVNVSILVYP